MGALYVCEKPRATETKSHAKGKSLNLGSILPCMSI